MTKLLINNLKIRINENEDRVFELAKKQLTREMVPTGSFTYSIHKKSVDARDKENILLVYSVVAISNYDIKIRESANIKKLSDDLISIEFGDKALVHRPLIVGMGPAGMFCALLLAENGFAPIIIDRGDNITDRTKALFSFIETGVLDLESNVQFGAGGAGTFSDGKLTTRINNPKCSYVLERLVEFGAPKEILIKAKPHIGTDILADIVDNILKRIEELGGTVIYRCRMDDIQIYSQEVDVYTTNGNFVTNDLVLAIGHSARDTYKMLLSKNLVIEPKPFSIGVRIEHLKEEIDRALYGRYANSPKLGAGEYNLSDTKGGRGVYTFCMCPGGEVVPATSQEYGVCVNGMSKFARDGVNSNCAINVSVFTDDYGNDPHQAITYQENLEKQAFILGGSDYSAPVQLVGDFMQDKAKTAPSRIVPTYAGGKRVRVANISNILPTYITQRLKEGLVLFDKRINGFASRDAVLTGVETRTSAPVRIMRNDDMTTLTYPCIYPCGEGAGYAGGIMSSAVDGINVALKIMKKYKI